MARHQFGRTRSDWAMATGEPVVEDDTAVGYVPIMLPEHPVTLWTERTGGTQVTDIVTVDAEDPIAELASDADGNIPAFLGPDGVRQMWASASADGESPRYSMSAIDLGDDIAGLDARVTTLESGGVGSAVPETLRWSAATVTAAQAAAPPASHRAYNLTGSEQTITAVHASAQIAPDPGELQFDILVDGNSVFSDPGDRPVIAATTHSSGVLSSGFSGSWPSGSYITVVPTEGDDAAESITVEVRVV